MYGTIQLTNRKAINGKAHVQASRVCDILVQNRKFSIIRFLFTLYLNVEG